VTRGREGLFPRRPERGRELSCTREGWALRLGVRQGEGKHRLCSWPEITREGTQSIFMEHTEQMKVLCLDHFCKSLLKPSFLRRLMSGLGWGWGRREADRTWFGVTEQWIQVIK
jgi:hypothetical protein